MTRFTLLLLTLFATLAHADDVPKRTFTNDVLPILQKNCLACHNESEYEGELVMESVELLMAGGDSGPAIVAGNADDSLLYQLAKYETDPVMPPEDNDVGAKRLSNSELKTLKTWIDQGAHDSSAEQTSKSINWQPIPEKFASVLAMEVSPDGSWLAAGRGNELVLYSISEGKVRQKLIDDSIQGTHPGAAHLDSVQSITWNADQTTIASGGYRAVKIWQRVPLDEVENKESLQQVTTSDGVHRIEIVNDGKTSVAKLVRLSDDKELAMIKPLASYTDGFADERIGRQDFQHGLQSERLRVYKSDVESAKKRKTDAENDVKKAEEEIKKSSEELPKKEESLAKVKKKLDDWDAQLKTLEEKKTEQEANIGQLNEQIKSADGDKKGPLNDRLKKSKEALKTTQDTIKSKSKERDKTKKEVEKAQQARDDSEKAIERSKQAKQRLEKSVNDRQSDIEVAENTLKDQQTIFDDSKAKLDASRDLVIPPWKRIVLSKNEKHFVLVNEAGHHATFSTKDGKLLHMESSRMGEWELVKTFGDPNGESPFANRITSLAFRNDGKVLAIGGGEPSRSGELQLWSTDDWSRTHVVEDIHSDVIYDLQFAPIGHELASCASDRMLKLIDSGTGKHIRTFEGHTGHVLGVSWRADGRTLATAGADQVVKVWDAKEGGQTKTISGFKEEITAVRFLGLENRMVFSTGKGHVHSRDSGGNNKQGFSKTTDYVHRVSCSRDGKIVAAAGTKRTIRVWDLKGKQIAEFK